MILKYNSTTFCIHLPKNVTFPYFETSKHNQNLVQLNQGKPQGIHVASRKRKGREQ